MPPPAPRRHAPDLPPIPRLDDSVIASARTIPPSNERPTVPPRHRKSAWANTLAQLQRYEDSARKYLPPDLRKKLAPVPRGALLGASLAAGVCAIIAVAFTGMATYRALSSPSAPVATSDTDSVPAEKTADQAAAAAPPKAAEASAPKADAPAQKANSDEASVLLDLAESLIAQHREGDVIPVVERLIARRPELKDDARLGRILMTTSAVDERRAATGSYTLLTGAMGETGAALMYELSLRKDVRDGVRRRAATWLGTKDFERVAPLPVYAAVRLRNATTCEDKHALLDFAGKAGGKYVLSYLRELDQKKLCAADDLVNCYPCMRNDNLLSETIAKVEQTTKP